MPYEEAYDLLATSGENFLIDKEKMQLLLTELKLNQTNPGTMFTKSEILVSSLQKRSKRMSKLVALNTEVTLIAGCSVKYLDSDVTLRNILLACRDFNETLAPAVYKQALLRTDQARLATKR